MKDMMNGHRPSLAIMIAEKMHGAKGKAKKEEEDGGQLEAMESFLAAVKKGDAEAALEEFQNLITMCGE